MDHKDLHFERTIAADPARLYHCLTDAATREIWGAPEPGHVVIVDTPVPATPGHRETSRCGPADNPYVTVHTDWVIADPGSLLVYAETLEAEGAPLGVTLACYEITPRDGGCALTLHLQVTSFVGPEMMTEVEGGWTHALDNLVTLAEDAAPAKEA